MKQITYILKLVALIGIAISGTEEVVAQQSIFSDTEVFNFLVGGREWSSRSPESCNGYRFTFDDSDNNPIQGNYTSYFRKEGSEWRYRGSGSAAYFNVEDGILTLTVARPSRRERSVTRYRIVAVSADQIDMLDETGQPFSYFNCANELSQGGAVASSGASRIEWLDIQTPVGSASVGTNTINRQGNRIMFDAIAEDYYVRYNGNCQTEMLYILKTGGLDANLQPVNISARFGPVGWFAASRYQSSMLSRACSISD